LYIYQQFTGYSVSRISHVEFDMSKAEKKIIGWAIGHPSGAK